MQIKAKKVPDWSMVSEVEVSYNPKIKPSERIKINGTKDAHRILRNSWDSNKIELQECCKVLLLNAGKVQGIYEVAAGGIDSIRIDSRLIFIVALKTKSTSFILAHNHPSGNAKPSDNDIFLTTTLKEAARILHIKLLDHIILTKNSYFSFADAGILKG